MIRPGVGDEAAKEAEEPIAAPEEVGEAADHRSTTARRTPRTLKARS